MAPIVKNQKEIITQKGEAEMKTMVQSKTAVRPQPKEAVVPESIAPVKAAIAPEPQEAPRQVIPEMPPNQGLCVTCNEAPDCPYAQKATAPVLYCEMFDDSQPKSQVKVEKQEASTHSTETMAPESNLKGLCVNCDNRHTCAFPKPEAGVWHCEEYS